MGIKQAQAFFAALIAWPVAAQDYNPVLIPPQIIGSPQTMTPLNGGDDSTRLVQFAFPFEYYGQTFTQAWVSSNGFVSFGDIGHLCCNGSPIDQAPRNAIYGLWTDLISGGNPYYRTDATSTVFGWYNTQEYGSGLPNTLEIALFPDGKIQWNYGDVNNQWHLVTAGLTGPTMADSISLFYGQNVNLLDNTSYIAGVPETPPPPPPPEPEPEPEPPFTPVDAAPSVIESPIAQQEQVEEQEAEQAVQQVIEEQAEETPVEATTEEIEQEEEEVAQEVVVETEEASDERLDPNQLEELAASPAQIDEQAISEAVEAVADEVAAAEAAKAEAANSSSNQADADVARADAPQLVQIEEAKVEAASDQQEMREMSAQQDVAQADVMTSQSSQEDGGSSVSIEEQPAIEIAAPQRADVVTIETTATTQLQAIENTAFSTQQQEQTTIVVEQNSSSIDVQQAPQIQQTEQTKEPERLIDGIISSLEGYQDINTAFFNKEAIEDADTFQRERVIPVSVQDVGIVASANAELAQTIGEQTTTETPAGTYDILIVDGPTFAPTPTTGMGDMTSPVNQAQQMELLNMAGMQSEMSAGPVIDVGDVNSGDNEAMTQLAIAPAGYSAYTQARIPDQPFYQPRDIYKGRRIPDSNVALYRMMRGQDQLWDDMVEDQYE